MVSDVYGRKISFALATTISAIFGFASAAAPNFHVSACQQLPGVEGTQHSRGHMKKQRAYSREGIQQRAYTKGHMAEGTQQVVFPSHQPSMS
jgi:hypothetical protein